MDSYSLPGLAALFLAAAAAGVLYRTPRLRPLPAILIGAASLLGTAIALYALLWDGRVTSIVSSVVPFSFALDVDRLGAFFLLLICAVSLPVTIFGYSYISRHYSPGRAAAIWALTSLFLGSMALVVTAATTFAFLFGWEMMTLFSAALILLDGTSEQRLHNVFIYLLMMHAGTAAVIGGFLAFLPYGSMDFASIRAAGAQLTPFAQALIFLFAFAGFGTKAGIVPLHLWLPRAHPIAPTPISALMSGVMLKTAVYGFVRFSFDFLHGGPAWAGYLALAVGAASALLGILYALAENDLKRLLAYSSVENIGLIYLALGAALVFYSHGAAAGACLALTGALFHSFNHALFKSLLFTGAGAISDATHTLSLDALGGLTRRMPRTGGLCLVGCAAIAGLPLLNGFAGEWLIYLALIQGAELPAAAARVALPLAVGVLAMTGALTAACFLKLFGIIFMGQPRSKHVEGATEAPGLMHLGMAMLAFACVVLGVLPMLMIVPASSVAASLVPQGPAVPEAVWIVNVLPALFAGMVLLTGVLAFLPRLRRTSPVWACGQPGLTPRMEYTAVSFSKPIRAVFSAVYRPDRKLETRPGAVAYFPESVYYRSMRTTSYERLLYRPIVNGVLGLANWLRRLQTGNIQVYLLYIFLTLVVLLLVLRYRA